MITNSKFKFISKKINETVVLLLILNSVWMPADCNNNKLPCKPNIIYIFTDQQSSSMMSCTGNKWLQTPAMDYIAQNGIRFTRAYTTNPVCSPARISMMTGRFPAYFNDNQGNRVVENEGAMKLKNISEEVKLNNLAVLLKSAGYEIAYGGKKHLPSPLIPERIGFVNISGDERDVLAQKASEYIQKQHEKPYFLIISLINPHDICYMAIRDFAHTKTDSLILLKGQTELEMLDKALLKPEGISNERFFRDYCPPLPINFAPQEDEPKAINWLINQRPFRINAREKYTENDWRMHRWAYCRLTEVVDSQVQIVLDALKNSKTEEQTIVFFSSDHGDMDAAHRLEHKTVLYEESAKVPFMAMWKGHFDEGRVDSTHLVSNGLDLLPTLCDFAGVKGKADARGLSLKPVLENKKHKWRKSLGVESEIGNMVVGANGLKYIRYNVAGIEETLFDLNTDPFEQQPVTQIPKYNKKLTEMRRLYDLVWFPETVK
jgi:choline-sulfatase